jgi:hypothetical protein
MPEPDTTDIDSLGEVDAAEAAIDQLIDTSSEDSFGHNGLQAAPPGPDDRDRLIEQLTWEVNQLKQELARVKA